MMQADGLAPRIRKTVAELAALTGGRAEGDAAYAVESAGGLDDAGPGDVSFLGNLKYTQAASASGAGVIFLPENGGSAIATKTKNRIYVEDPQYAFSLVLELIDAARPKASPVIDAKADVHGQAKLGPNVAVGAFCVVERGAVVGEGTQLGPQCFVGANTRIGRSCKIHPQVVIRENCVIGDRAVIHSGTVIGADGFGFSTDRKTGKHRKIPQIGNVVIGDDVEIGANVAIDRATVGSTVIQAGTKIDNLVQIAHNVQVGKDCLLVSQVGIAGSCVIGERVILAGQAGLAGHLRIGDGSVIMAQTGVMSDVENGMVLFGTPARPHREAFKLQALYGRLPELFKALRKNRTEA